MSRLIVLISCAGAILFQAAYVAPVDRGTVALGVAAVVLVAGLVYPSATRAVVIFAAATAPALVAVGLGISANAANRIWIAALFALILSETRLKGWSIPRAWQLPVALWGMALALGWPLVVARESDFSFRVFQLNVPVTGRGMPPKLEAFLVANFTSIQLVGLLWIDALFATFAKLSRDRFEREVVWPFGAGVLVSVLFAFYQMSVNAGFLNPSVYGGTGRASGLIIDGNVFGVVAAMWIAGFALLAYRVQGAARLGLVVVAILSCATVWGSGSRTAMLLACCTVAGAAWAFWNVSHSARVRLIGAVAIATVISAGALAVFSGAITQGPLKRIEAAIQRSRGRQGLVRYLWERDGYGTAAVQMIKESPLVGVGPGAFYALVMDYSRLKNPSSGINTDNAQNWFRHELAELGILGSLGWICLVTMLAVNIGRSRIGSNAEQATLIAAALVGLGLASMLGMPTQHVVALVLFWTFVFWHHQLAAPHEEYAWLMPSRAKWLFVATVLAAFAVGTTYIAHTSFRVPHRALRFGWPFTYGFDRVNIPSAQPFRRTARKAVTVFPTQDRYVKMTFWAEHPDIGSNPVTVRIWRDSRLIAAPTLSSHAPVTWYVRTRPDHPWMMIETEVDRTWKEVVQRGSPRREFGVTIEDWQFVAQPPIYAVLIE